MPQEEIQTVDPYDFEKEHLTLEQVSYLKNIIGCHKEAISTPENPLGSYKLFQASINLFPGKKPIQAKRQINYDLISADINRMESLGIIAQNYSNNLDCLANLVIVLKSSRLCKADKFLEKQVKREVQGDATEKQNKGEVRGDPCQNPYQDPGKKVPSKNPNYRLTIDLSDVNSILWGQRFINLSKNEELLETLTDCYLSKVDIAEYFFSFNLDQLSQKKINFYYKNQFFSFLRLPQGLANSPWFSVLGTSLAFSNESLMLFLEKYPEFKNDEVFSQDVSKIVSFYIDDGLIFSKKSYGWQSHLKIVKYVLYIFEIAGLKIKTEKFQFLVQKTDFLGLHLNTSENVHFIPTQKLAGFQKWSKPLSQGELNSRLSCLNFYSKYIPFF